MDAVSTLGEVSRQLCNVTNPPEDDLALQRKTRRFRLQRHASYLLKDEKRLARLRPGATERKEASYRVANCMWALNWEYKGVTLSKTARGVSAQGLQICASVWHCPVCAARIANERRLELLLAVTAAEAMDLKTVFVTYTARHEAMTVLREQLEAMTKAYQAVWRGAPADRLKARYGIFGIIRSLEATHSKRNGWHPHIHAIMFVSQDADIDSLRSDLGARWQVMAAKHGLTMNEHGFDLIDDTKRVAEYLAKYGHEPRWQSADELARWHTKIGRSRGQWEHFTPWQLLEFSEAGDKAAGDLFREYAVTFHGRRQLVWSDGLRAALGLKKELTDQEAAEKEMDEPELLKVYLDADQWDIVKGNDARVEAMEIVNQGETVEIIQAGFLAFFGFCPLITLPTAPEESDELAGVTDLTDLE